MFDRTGIFRTTLQREDIHKNEKAFTLVEILLVVIIIGILASMVLPNLAGKSEMTRRKAAQSDIDANLSVAIDLYEIDNGKYPTTDQGLKALIEKPTAAPVPEDWSGPYVKKKKIPEDPWGHSYVYVSPGVHNPEGYDLSSLGSDGVESDDDISNWE